MPNYYELLKLEPDASETEIESRLDDQYTKWRSLVTHHDTTVVSQANQALHTLEEIRTTLLNPQSRLTYNKVLASERENLGGLADPDIVLAQNPVNVGMAPPRSRSKPQASPSSEIERTDAWICSKCKKVNPTNTRFCRACGHQIGIECPSCRALTQEINKFCENCGVNIKESIEIKEEQARLAEKERKEIAQREAIFAPLRTKLESSEKLSSIWWFFLLPIGAIPWIIALVQSISVLNSTQIQGGEYYRETAKKVRNKTAILLSLFLVPIIGYILCLVSAGFVSLIGNN
jgi:ribosomal protein L40E